MIMEAVKRNVCRGVIFLMACLTCVVVFGSGLIAKATNYSPYAPYTTYTGFLGINVTKTLIGREFREGDEFTFKIEPHDKKYNTVSSETVTIGAMNNGEDPGNTAEADDRAISIKFTWPGEYVYYISEVEPDKDALPGIIYDQTEYKVTVTVSEKKAALDGSESEKATGQGGQTDNEGGSTKVPGSDNTANGEGNAPATAGSKNENDPIVDPSGSVENNITPAVGGEENGLSGDGDNQSGGDDAQSKESVPKELEVTNVKVEKRSSSDGEWGTVVYNGPPLKDKQYCAFTNIYGTSVDLTGTKTLSGRDFQSDDTFTFTITPKDGAPAPVDDEGERLTEVTIRPTSGENPAEIDFGTIYFTPEVLGEGENPQTFTYTITEQSGSIGGMTYDTAQRTVLIEVELQDDGSVTAEVVESESSELLWTNTWKDPDEPGGDPGDDPDDDPGDDPRPSYTSLTVNKVWVLDDGGEAPVSVTVELLRNNRVYEEVTLDEDNDWSHTWTRLDARYNWKVQEADVPDGFTAEVSHRGTIWTITNDDIPEDPETPPEEPDEPDTPEDPDTPDEPDIPGTPDEPDVPDTPDTPDEPNTPNEPTLPQTGQNWRLVWILAITGAVLVLVGILGKKRYHGKHEA